ncbi:hypothetical protein CRENBAI_002555 [Crenichthys baileyi]|uniref:UPAR/Ly6 domain-containing protein n=1 Tax=Crenichthys baileyi TaxID=28760 RepID=A0AAV9S2C3_9TELE
MGKFLFAVVAAVASLVLAESLICNKCRFSLFGTCLGRDNDTCTTNVSVCATQRTTFTSLPEFVGFSSQGCQVDDTGCNTTTTSTLLGVAYEAKLTCCNHTDRCNPIVLNGAPSTKMTFTAAIGADSPVLTSDQPRSPGRETASGLEEKERRVLLVGLKPRTKSTEMGKFLFAVVAAVASLVLAESLICNKCRFSLFGTCLGRDNDTCTTNDSVCSTERTTFSSLPEFVGFNSQGCQVNDTGCNATTTSTLLGVAYEAKLTCCNHTDRCNPIVLNGAPSTKMTFTAAIGAGLLASMWGSLL